MQEIAEVSSLTEDQLKRLEDKVRRGAAAFIETGQALARIREGKGYRLRGFDTFESYCQKEFGFTDRQGRRLIQSAETAAEVKKLTGETVANESVAREFAPLVAEPEKLARVVAQIEKKGGIAAATAEAVKETVQKLAPKAKAAPAGDGHKLAPVVLTPQVEAPSGECPHCRVVPQTYQSKDSGTHWTCSQCSGDVMLTVVKWPTDDTVVCKSCGHATTGYLFCTRCGGKL